MASSMRGQSRLRRTLRRWPEEMRTEIRHEMVRGAQEIEDAIRAHAPKDEGHLAAEAHSKVSSDGLSAVIGYSQTKPGFVRPWRRGGFEALFQEFGTRHHSAQPFVRPAFRSRIPDILKRIDAAVDKVLRRGSGS